MAWFSRLDFSLGPDEDDPGGCWPITFGGVLAPLLLAAAGLYCLVTQRGVLPGRGHWLTLTGPDAVALGVACLGAALTCHSHYLWGNVRPSGACHYFGQILGLLAFIAGIGYLFLSILLP